MIETFMIAAMQLSIFFCTVVIVGSYLLLGFMTILSYTWQLTSGLIQSAYSFVKQQVKKPALPAPAFTTKNIGVNYGRIAYK
ncbi:hypothetical protein H0V99_02490 [Candidatus Saccharibacteria bacterium]|nr:hypothetical protein [Candidatus Saccharibacteria bacterium]